MFINFNAKLQLFNRLSTPLDLILDCNTSLDEVRSELRSVANEVYDLGCCSHRLPSYLSSTVVTLLRCLYEQTAPVTSEEVIRRATNARELLRRAVMA